MKLITKLLISLALTSTSIAFADTTHRIPQLSNSEVTVWETIIYPGKENALPMHKHKKGRVLVALTDGTIKFAEKNGQGKIIKIKTGHSYYLPADDMHTDENVGTKPVKVVVVSLN